MEFFVLLAAQAFAWLALGVTLGRPGAETRREWPAAVRSVVVLATGLAIVLCGWLPFDVSPWVVYVAAGSAFLAWLLGYLGAPRGVAALLWTAVGSLLTMALLQAVALL